MASEILLISEIEKRSCLYNYTLLEYNKKEVFSQAWSEIADTCQMTVQECKDKWKNIRSSYGRSLRRDSSKLGKPYYLSNYLQFLNPFLKAHDFNSEAEVEFKMDNTSNLSSELILSPDVKHEPVDVETVLQAEETGYVNHENSIQMTVTQPHVLTINPGVPTQRKRRKFKHVSAVAAKKRKISPAYHVITPPGAGGSDDENSPMRMFMMSLLPEFDSMSQDQIRLFKIKVLMLIDDIKTRSDEVRRTLKSDNEANIRLQKKLINLLIRHLPEANADADAAAADTAAADTAAVAAAAAPARARSDERKASNGPTECDQLGEKGEQGEKGKQGENGEKESYVTETVHGNPVLVRGRYRFNRSNGSTLDKGRWYCIQKDHGCKAAVHTLFNDIVKHVNSHNH